MMTILTSDYIYEVARANDAEMKLKEILSKFGLFTEHARCYLCEEKIGSARWLVGEYASGNQEVVHVSCWEEEAERAASEKSYWCGSSDEEIEGIREALFGPNKILEDLPFKEIQGEAYYHGSRSGEPSGEAAGATGTDIGNRQAAEAFAASEGFGTYAGGHSGSGSQPDAEGSRSPIHVAGYRGTDKARLPERIVTFDGDPITMRVPLSLKAILAADVEGQPIVYDDEDGTGAVQIERILKGLHKAGEL